MPSVADQDDPRPKGGRRFAFIPSPPSNGFHFGPLFVHAYGLMYVLAALAAVAIAIRRWEARGGDRSLVYQVAGWGFPAGDPPESRPAATSPAGTWSRTHGGVRSRSGTGDWVSGAGSPGGALAGVWVLKRRGANVLEFMDAAAPALLVAQAIGRVGNYFNQELFGGPTALPWGLEIDPAHRPTGYGQYPTFQPTFLYELMWDLTLAGLLIWLGRACRVRPPGLFALYVSGYSLGRVGEELLRVDPSHHVLGMRLNFWVASALVLLWRRVVHPHPERFALAPTRGLGRRGPRAQRRAASEIAASAR